MPLLLLITAPFWLPVALVLSPIIVPICLAHRRGSAAKARR